MRISRPQPARTGKKSIVFFLFALFCAAALPAQQKNVSEEKRRAIEKAVASFMSANSVPGLSAAILRDKLLKRSTRDLMWTFLKTTEGKETGYGLGWGIMEKFGLHIFAHTGGQQGTSTALAVVPSRNAGVVVLCNLDGVDVDRLAMQILRIALDLPENAP